MNCWANSAIRRKASPTRLEGMETTDITDEFVSGLIGLRPALRGWKPRIVTLNDEACMGLRPALRGWKLGQKL